MSTFENSDDKIALDDSLKSVVDELQVSAEMSSVHAKVTILALIVIARKYFEQ